MPDEQKQQEKHAVAAYAAAMIEPGMVVGLGSGTTSTLFIELLGRRVQTEGLRIRGIASSQASETLARSLGIPIVDFATCPEIDLNVDGADEIAPGLALIKGGGGALLREKIVASAAKRFAVIADASKRVDVLGRFPLPVEVIPMAAPLVARRLQALGLRPRVRPAANGAPGDYITDEGNLLLDCGSDGLHDPERMSAQIREIVGVVEHGLFLGMATVALIAHDGRVEEQSS